MCIEDLVTFDYAKLVRSVLQGTEDRFWDVSRQGKVPHFREFQKFQTQADIAFLKELIADVREAGGEGIPVAVNACMFLPDWLICAEFADFFVTELGMQHEPESIPVLQYKIAEALNRPLAAWPTGGAVRMVDDNGLHELVRIWVAVSYALGVNLMIPDNMWAHAAEDGSQHTYSADREATVPLYKMVQDYAVLFDDYSAVQQALLVYSNPARRRSWVSPVHHAAFNLFDRNIPFKLALSADLNIPKYATTSEKELQSHEFVIIPESLTPENYAKEEIEILTKLVENGDAVLWERGVDLDGKVDPMVSLEKGEGIWLVPRIKQSDPEAPLVVHAINNDYDRETDTLETRSGITVRISGKLAGRDTGNVKVVMPGKAPVELDVERTQSGDLLVPLPSNDLWWVIVVEKG
jgi:hypothetical protein